MVGLPSRGLITVMLTKIRRRSFAVLIVLIPLLGLLIRARPEYFPKLFAIYTPDILWAFLVFSLVVVFAPKLTCIKTFVIALAITYFMELSQLYQAPFINDIRDTRVGGLLLGHGFLWSDLLCYTFGITVGAVCDLIIRRRTARRF